LIISGPRMRTTSISPPNSDRWAQSDNFDPIRLSGLWAPAPRKLTNTQAAMKYIKLFDQSIWPIGDINLKLWLQKSTKQVWINGDTKNDLVIDHAMAVCISWAW
jgi:hypothetical protein